MIFLNHHSEMIEIILQMFRVCLSKLSLSDFNIIFFPVPLDLYFSIIFNMGHTELFWLRCLISVRTANVLTETHRCFDT